VPQPPASEPAAAGAASAPSTPLSPRFGFSAGGGLLTPTPSTLNGLLALDVDVTLARRWRLGLLGAGAWGSTVAVLDDAGRQRGTLTGRALYLLPHAMLCTTSTVSFCGGLRLGARFALGTAEGQYLFQTRVAWSPSPAVGPAARLAFGVGVFVLSVDATLLVNLTTPRLGVEGLAAGIDTPRLELLLHFNVGLRTR
jgi:hypothetical protein